MEHEKVAYRFKQIFIPENKLLSVCSDRAPKQSYGSRIAENFPHASYKFRPTYFFPSYNPNSVGEEYKLRSSSVCNFLHPTVSFPFLDANNLFRVLF